MTKELCFNPQLNITSIEFLQKNPMIEKLSLYRSAFKVKRRSPKPEVPISERYTLTVDEAAAYFGIGQSRLRNLINENPNADYLLAIGNRTMFKRKLFEEYVDNATCI